MQGIESFGVATLENQITARYGLLLSQAQLAELLGRTTGGLRYKSELPQRSADPRPQAVRPQDRPPCLLPGHRGRPDYHRYERRVSGLVAVH